ncbi:MAG: cell division FtsK/SpoIIIE [Candidatus Moranbacteria bacterium GW2011_GWE1_35_17]|nr:MAG: cell division FtsK/SpoIIIE [Candidatus Moranbacteria bacterium GW2011_GWE1_35_17]KKP82995.1 MAG: cell division FtsK/SpoIIIE [Candidatus Moranbacteria bacterium GW2011_GWF2_35_54]KKP84442.1 MAG: cell division FtsK/SpoIIIE [Candidatus Moranbacteria bacterium GW2011_GWF1_35_5]
MKKKPKNKNSQENQDREEKFNLNLKNSVKRGIAVVLLFLLTILFSFGFFGAGGSFGHFLDKIGGIIFGWGKWLFPITLFLMAVILLYKKKTVFYVVKIAGLAVVFLSLLGFFHIFYEYNILAEVAKNGQGGGYIGYFIAWSLIKLTGKIVGIIFLVAFFSIGVMIAFNFSLVEFFINLFKKKESEEVANKKDYENIVDNEKNNLEKEEVENIGITELIDEADLGCNIKEVKFVEGPSAAEIDEEEIIGGEEKGFNIKSTSFESKTKNIKPNKASKISSGPWKLPSLTLLDESTGEAYSGNIDENTDIIKDTFSNFGIALEDGGVKIGPAVTQYSFRPAVGVKLSKIVALGDDLALALAAHPIRIEAPIPGKSLIGIEVPNKKSIMIRLKNALESEEFKNSKSPLTLALGKNVEGKFVVADLGKMPHLLIAGATGTGKSVCINSIILSLLFQNSPDDLKMILVDPKRVELSLYNKIPHLLSPVITDNKKVVNSLKWAVREMEERYKILEAVGSRDLESYSQKFKKGMTRDVIDPDTSEVVKEELKKLPFIVIVIDELADLMVSHGKDVEGAIMRLAQMARAVGIHLIISTQRPSVEVLTGIIKANITTRIALQVASQIDSRTILDMRGAENLLGKGDLLFLSSESPKPRRLQNSFVSENEVKRVVEYIIDQADRVYKKDEDDDIEEELLGDANGKNIAAGNNFGQVDFSIPQDNEDEDAIYDEVKEFVLKLGKASASLLQRRFRIGYNRAARLIDSLENDGIVGGADGSKPREVLPGGNISNRNKEAVDNNKDTEDITQEQREKWQI